MTRHIRILSGKLDRKAGSHVYNAELANRLAARGYRVSATAFAPPTLASDRVAVTVLPLSGTHRNTPVVWRFAAVRDYRAVSRALAHAELSAPDLVIGAEHLLLKAHVRRFPRTPLLYLPHSLLVDEEIKSYNLSPAAHWATARLYRGLQIWALRHAARTVRFTRHACNAMIDRYGDRIRSPFVVNPMGVDLPRWSGGVDHTGPVRLLWVGQLISRKRLELAIAALAGIRHLAWHFDIVGDGESRAALERQTQELGLRDRVTFHGFQSDPSAWFAQGELILFPSWLENSPVTMLEAMSHGVPCLAMKHDGVVFFNANDEIIQDGVDGFLAARDEDFVAAIARLVQQRPALRAAGLAARSKVEGKHTWEHHLDRYEQLFNELQLA